MLESLDAVNWSHLEHAYGPADDVPDLIRALTSPLYETRRRTFRTLYSNIYHQGTVYEATAYAVPFLIELLEGSGIRCKAEILVLLAHLARGYSYIEQHQDLEFTFTKEERSSPAFAERLRKEQTWVKNAHEAVGKGFPLYLDLLRYADPMIRMSAAYILSCFQEYTARSRPALHSSLRSEGDPSAKAGILLSLSALSEHDSPLLNLFMEMMHGSEPRLVRVIAAMQLARLTRDTPSLEVVQVLLDALAHPEDIQNGYAELPWSNMSLTGDICRVLSTLAPERMAPLVIPVLLDIFHTAGQASIERQRQREAELRQVNADNPHHPPEQVFKMAAAMNNFGLMGLLDVARALLHYAFQGKAVENPRALTATQRAVLTTIAINDAAWTFNGNMYDLLHPLFPSADQRRFLLATREFVRNLVQMAAREELE